LVIPTDLQYHAEMSAAALTIAIRRVGLSTSSHDSSEGPAFACKFTISATEMVIEARSDGRGEGEEHIDIKCPTLAGQEPMVVGVAGKQVLDFLKVVNQGDLKMSFKDKDTSLVFRPLGTLGFDYQYLTMPCRLKF
jgi:DNA polymerase III sliding clamp (beta) subunit (PCNA family)